MKIKKLLSSTAIILMITSKTQALESEVKIKGGIDLQAVHYTSNGNKVQKTFSKNQKQYGIYSAGNLYFD